MSFTTKGVDTTETRGVGKFIKYGIGKYKINDIEVKTASTGAKQCILHMETPPVTIKGFEGADGHLGQLGKVKMPKTYMKTDEQLQDFVKNIAIIGDKMGKRTEIDAIELVDLSDLDNYITKVKAVLGNKFAFWKLSAQEYWDNKTNSKKVSLFLPRWGFIASLDEGEKHLKFDKSKSYDYEEVQVPDQTAVDSKMAGAEASPWED